MAIDIREMQEMQKALQAEYAGIWEQIDPAHGKNKMLWMLAEMGEAIQLVKRRQEQSCREAFIEELADVLMYFNDVLLCYGITPEEFETIYRAKHQRNLTRWKKPDRAAGKAAEERESN